MKMFVGVDVIKRQARGREGFELGFDLGCQLAANMRQEKHRRPGPHHIRAEKAV